MNIQAEYERWLNSPIVSKEEKELLKSFSREEIDDAFYKNIDFGTAGMRGILGPGTNRMNIFTIRKASVGYAKYLLEKYEDAKVRGVVIAHDNRFFSREFTMESARVLNAFGIKAYLFDSLRPTPELSYAVRKLNACGGIVITASHNPKEYNGYKVYDEYGCQLVPSKISRLLEIIDSLPNELDVEVPHFSSNDLLISIPSTLDDEYVNDVLSIRLNPTLSKEGFKIVFSPQHGTSYVNGMRIFKEAGYEVIPVETQCSPDPNFSGTLSPNPEEKKAYVASIELAKKENAQLILMTDPDADRVGVAYLSSKGTYEYLNGNESGALLMDYIFMCRKERNSLLKNGVMFNTIVTSSFGKDVASYYGIRTESLLTGFKYIGDRIQNYQDKGENVFEFGYEESYGCLISPFVRDKDGLQALLMLAEMAVYYFNKGIALDEALDGVYKKLGNYYKDIQHSKYFKGESGSRDIVELMKKLRTIKIDKILGLKVIRVEDYLKSESIENGITTTISLPKSDVIKFILEGGSSIAIRPSGTEPKCKFYINAVGKNMTEVEELPEKLYESFASIVNI